MMIKPSENVDMRVLFAQIENLCNHFKEIRQEAMGIASTNQMPDATLHLNDVLQSTEEAATTILDAATTIGEAAESLKDDAVKQRINDEVMRIFVACSFQDISGQRIKKVLRHLNLLEEQLLGLSQTARSHKRSKVQADALLNGPALSGEGPSQSEVDDMFAQAGNAPQAG